MTNTRELIFFFKFKITLRSKVVNNANEYTKTSNRKQIVDILNPNKQDKIIIQQ